MMTPFQMPLPPQNERGRFPEWLLNSWNRFLKPEYSPETRAAMARGEAMGMEAAQNMLGGGTTRMVRPVLGAAGALARPALGAAGGAAGALAQRFRGAVAPPPPAPGGVPQWYSQRLSETMQTQLRQRRANVLDSVPTPPTPPIPRPPIRPPDVVGGLRRRFGGSQVDF